MQIHDCRGFRVHFQIRGKHLGILLHRNHHYEPGTICGNQIAIATIAMSSFNAYRITKLNSEISALKSKTDLLVDVSHLHEAHLHHLEQKTDATNILLADLLESNIWFTTKFTDAVEKKFQSIVHHHENMVKSAQHHRLAPGALPHDILDKILNHTLSVARKMNMVYFVNYASDLFQVEVSHLYDPKTPHFTLGHSKSYQTISSTDVHLFLHLLDTFFCKGRQVMGRSLKKSNAEAI
jgi:hypothetical protein